MRIFNKVVIIGTGLIGGSIGLALKKKNFAREVVGVARRECSRRRALKFNAVDKATLNIKEAIKDAEFAVIATPVGSIVDIAKDIIKYAKNKIVITDAGSTKEEIVRAIERIYSQNVSFVGSHPMAGSEKSGVEFAKSTLFNKSICIITKTKKTDLKALNIVKRFWSEIGATCRILAPDVHDRYISSVSHLPHIAAVALTVSAHPESLKYASTGFKDTTRIASSNPDLWQDIFKTNKRALLYSLYEYKKALEGMEDSIKTNNSKSLFDQLEKAKNIRDKIK